MKTYKGTDKMHKAAILESRRQYPTIICVYGTGERAMYTVANIHEAVATDIAPDRIIDMYHNGHLMEPKNY